MLAALFPWELGQKADPFGATPVGIKPEWYFVSMFQTLKDIPSEPIPGVSWLNNELVGLMLFGLIGLGVVVVPLLDRGATAGWPRRVLNFFAALLVALFIFMTIRGYVKSVQEAAQQAKPVAASEQNP